MRDYNKIGTQTVEQSAEEGKEKDELPIMPFYRVRSRFRVAIVLLGIGFVINRSPAGPNIVLGNSMAPTILSYEVRLIDRLYPNTSEIKRGDIVVCRYDGELLTKRVYGVPGDTIYEVWLSTTRDAVLAPARVARRLIKGGKGSGRYYSIESIKLKDNEYYIAGDNVDSYDSRNFGPVSHNDIVALSRPFTLQSLRAVASEASWIARGKIEEITFSWMN